MTIEYEPLDMSEIEQEAERVTTNPAQQQSGKDNPYVQLPDREGYVLMRILPRKKGNPLYKACRLHSLRNAAGEKRRFYSPKELEMTDRGLRWTGGSVIDKYLRDLWKQVEVASGQKQKDLKQQYRDLKSYERYYYNVIVREERDSDGNVLTNVGPKIFSCGKTVHAMIMRAMRGDKKAGLKPLGDITHPQNGRDFRLVKKIAHGADGDYPNYDLSCFEDPSALGTAEDMEKWMANLHDLDAIKEVKSEDELKHALKVHLGIITDDSVADEDYDPDEFRVPTGSSVSVPVATEPEVKETVREDLVTPEFEGEDTPAEEEDILADEDFMNELDGI